MASEKKRVIHIYRIYFPESDKCYIGQTSNMCRRMFQHLRSDSLVGRALRKYDGWCVVSLHVCKTKALADKIETKEINNFRSIRPSGYNLTQGGEGGDTFTNNPNKEKIRRKHSDCMMGKKIATGSIWSEDRLAKARLLKNAKGHKWSKESRERQSIAQRGNKNGATKHTEESKLRMKMGCLKYNATRMEAKARKEMGDEKFDFIAKSIVMESLL